MPERPCGGPAKARMLYYDDARHANLYVVEPEGVSETLFAGWWWVVGWGSLLPGIGAAGTAVSPPWWWVVGWRSLLPGIRPE